MIELKKFYSDTRRNIDFAVMMLGIILILAMLYTDKISRGYSGNDRD